MSETVLLLRTCNKNMLACSQRMREGKRIDAEPFRWPTSGPVECDDWDSRPVCGGGLHGLLYGVGNVDRLSKDDDAQWIVFEALLADVVEITEDGGGKAKAPRGNVIYCGKRDEAIALLVKQYPDKPVIYGTATAGDGGTATAGDGGTATAGYGGTATAGYGGTATAGYGGTATAGDGGTATAGYGGTLSLRWWDGSRYRIAIFYVGEDGIEPNTPYRCESGKPVKVVK